MMSKKTIFPSLLSVGFILLLPIEISAQIDTQILTNPGFLGKQGTAWVYSDKGIIDLQSFVVTKPDHYGVDLDIGSLKNATFSSNQVTLETEHLSGSVEDYSLGIGSSKLNAVFDKHSGLLTVTDKRTGQKWKQYYTTMPPGTEVLPDPQFTNQLGYSWHCSDRINVSMQIVSVGQMNEKALSVDTHLLKNATFSPNTIRLETGHVGIKPLAHILRIRYKTEEVSNLSIRANLAFFENGYAGGFVAGELLFTSSETTDWKVVEWQIPPDSIVGQNVVLYFDMESVNGIGSGKLYLSEVNLLSSGEDGATPFTFSNAQKQETTISFDLTMGSNDQSGSVRCVLEIDPQNEAGLIFSMEAAVGREVEQLAYPPLFHSSRSDLNWVIPAWSGMLLPSMDLDLPENTAGVNVLRGPAYGQVLNMGFVGAVNLSRGDGYLYVIDSMADVWTEYSLSALTPNVNAYLPRIVFHGDKGKFGNTKRVRYLFIPDGGYVAQAKVYREIAKEKGYLVTLKEKEKIVPDIARAISAPMIHSFETREVLLTMINDLAEAGIPRAAIAAGYRRMTENGEASVSLDEIHADQELFDSIKKNGYMPWIYDNYRDIFFAADAGKMAWVEPVKTWLYDEDKLLINKFGQHQTAWIEGDVASRLMCPAFNVETASRWVGPIVQNQPGYRYWFVDVLASVSPAEGICYHPNHPTSFTDVMRHRADLMKSLMTDHNMVTGYECAAEYLVPYAIAGEGNLELIGMPGRGRPEVKIPLWDLVFHDCFQLYYHWEVPQNHPVDNWWYKDATVALHGGLQKFSFHHGGFGVWRNLGPQVIASIKKVNESLRLTEHKPMTDHQFLTEDRLVQMTEFGPGVKVIANFSDADYRYHGEVIQARDFITIEEGRSSDLPDPTCDFDDGLLQSSADLDGV